MVSICLFFQQDTSKGISSNISIIGLKLAMKEKRKKAFDSIYLLFELKEPHGQKSRLYGRAMTKEKKKKI